MNFKMNSRTLFIIIFKLKNDNFKTQDFSLLVKRVITGVMCTAFLIDKVLLFSWLSLGTFIIHSITD